MKKQKLQDKMKLLLEGLIEDEDIWLDENFKEVRGEPKSPSSGSLKSKDREIADLEEQKKQCWDLIKIQENNLKEFVERIRFELNTSLPSNFDCDKEALKVVDSVAKEFGIEIKQEDKCEPLWAQNIPGRTQIDWDKKFKPKTSKGGCGKTIKRICKGGENVPYVCGGDKLCPSCQGGGK